MGSVSAGNNSRIMAEDELSFSCDILYLGTTWVNASNTTLSTVADGPYYSGGPSSCTAETGWNFTSGKYPQGQVSISADVSGYYNRTRVDFINNGSPINYTQFLLPVSNPNNAWVTFTAVSPSFSPISNALVTVSKSIGGVQRIIATGYSDSSGSFKIVLDQLSTYFVNASYGGISSGDMTIVTPSGSYNLIIQSAPWNVSWTTALTNVTVSLSPFEMFYNDSNTTVVFNVSSSDSKLVLYGLNVTVNSSSGSLVFNQTGSTASGGSISGFLTFNATNQSWDLFATYYWVRSDGLVFNNTVMFHKAPTVLTQYSLVHFFGVVKTAGFGEFGLAFMAIVITLFVAGFITKFNPTFGSLAAIILLGMFAYWEWINIYLATLFGLFGVAVFVLSVRT